jgi:hypothetical protein
VPLLEDDERYLEHKELDWEIIVESGVELLVIKNFAIDKLKYDHEAVDLLIIIPPQYNSAQLDMWYVEPWIKLLSTGGYPPTADQSIQFLGRTWQRFSRHFPIWRPGVDTLSTLLVFAFRELQSVPASVRPTS